MTSHMRKVFIAVGIVALITSFGAVAFANHGLEIASKKANENASLPTLENETAANAGSEAKGPKAEADENESNANGNDGDSHGACVSKAAKDKDTLLTNAGADLDEDPWRRGAFISALARTDHEMTKNDCDGAIAAALTTALNADGPGKSAEDHGNSEANSHGQETAANARGEHGPQD